MISLLIDIISINRTKARSHNTWGRHPQLMQKISLRSSARARKSAEQFGLCVGDRNFLDFFVLFGQAKRTLKKRLPHPLQRLAITIRLVADCIVLRLSHMLAQTCTASLPCFFFVKEKESTKKQKEIATVFAKPRNDKQQINCRVLTSLNVLPLKSKNKKRLALRKPFLYYQTLAI